MSYTEDTLFYDVQGDEDHAAGSRVFFAGEALTLSLSAVAGFFVNMFIFCILGQELGRQLTCVDNPIRAYAWDIGGSLAGVAVYTLLSALGTPPHLWYAVGGLLLLFFLRDRRVIAAAVAALVIVAALVAGSYQDAQWSPYYKVETVPYRTEANRDLGFQVRVDNMRIQDALRFSPELEASPLKIWRPYYEMPYHIVKPQKVLVLGAGGGNDVVFALKNGAEEVHAVEIDPVIAHMGRTTHPELPYKSDKVTAFVDDARAYISSTTETYDLIVMSALDSHKQVAGMSSLRLESFVYTVESFRQIQKLLKPGGTFVMNLTSGRPWMGPRTYWSLTEAFGSSPAVLSTVGAPYASVAYVYTPKQTLETALNKADTPLRRVIHEYAPRSEVRLSTDNWPHLYLESNRAPMVVVVVLSVMIFAAILIVMFVAPNVRRPNLHFFFLGAGFMLLETRSITQMAQLFGATWSINALVFGAILLTILMTNHMVLRNRMPPLWVSYALLFLSLVGGYFFSFDVLLSLGPVARIATASLIIGLPIAWASFIFSHSFRTVTDVPRAFGSNLLGVVVGGATEYMSMLWGLDILYAVALVFYLGSLLFLTRNDVSSPVSA